MTEAAKHTPGPWGYRESDFNPFEVFPLHDGPPEYGQWAPVCEVSDAYNDENEGENEANARLIAAAPDMLAALTAMCDRFPYWFPHDSGHCDPAALALVTNARAAIAKATAS